MICRKDTLGYIDFLRGKYNLYDKQYIVDMINQMTISEREKLLNNNFDYLWNELWGSFNVSKYKNEESTSKDKFNLLKTGCYISDEFVCLKDIIMNNTSNWNEPEWGFPKGRRNYQEKDYSCALREFEEETGYSLNLLHNINNITPFEEIFTGSNYKSYKHKYYLAYMKYNDSDIETIFQDSEVSKIKWKTYDECISCIRNYNLEKKQILKNINEIISTYRIFIV
tara:strand:- start:226 stop:900 length:675 start_codon:yes stop_codon:yes gene_type:complete